jgi:hypothetical protein
MAANRGKLHCKASQLNSLNNPANRGGDEPDPTVVWVVRPMTDPGNTARPDDAAGGVTGY